MKITKIPGHLKDLTLHPAFVLRNMVLFIHLYPNNLHLQVAWVYMSVFELLLHIDLNQYILNTIWLCCYVITYIN
ncbi:hypothetical protein VQ7734_01795 [Vibrio quintilis]|uniref:Uncharacterized protein n=1 Tax=Vibrio quintilis TaxID=1117707 RepID=A0A1M7YTW6_9VIBR|nr:hypothetical protein VQ7734_01795 [Vibrio quintilis]